MTCVDAELTLSVLIYLEKLLHMDLICWYMEQYVKEVDFMQEFIYFSNIHSIEKTSDN